MEDRSFHPIHTGSDADLAFAVVVLASYFTTFSSMQTASAVQLLIMIGLGVAYIAIGIYGYALVFRTGKVAFHILYFVVQMVLGGLIVYVGKGAPFNAMVLLPLAGHSVMLLSRYWRLAVNLGIILVFVTASGFNPNDLSAIWSGLPLFLGGQIFIVIFTEMAVSEKRARASVEKLIKDLNDANQNLREYALQAEELAITKERNRMAREIHDGLGHYLTTIFMQIQAARAVMKADSNKAQDMLNTAQNLTQEALLDVRKSVATLRNTGEGMPLTEEIEKMLQSCERGGLSAEMKVVGAARPLAPPVQWTVYRTIQEGLNNTSKHASASHLCVTLDYTQAKRLRLIVQDDGRGADHLNGGFGLVGMRERINLLKGDLTIETAPGNGFKIIAMIPYEEAS